ncbi:MAG: hypothetical protein R2939_13330 [Kofleriaceae bacterium]
MSESRSARRFVVNAPAVVESIGQPPVNLHANLASVYQRVAAAGDDAGRRFPAVVRDLSTNGAFISGEALPLLARVAIHFEVRGVGPIDAIGWVLWRRHADCEVPGPGGEMVTLPRGFGILFEAIPLDTRIAIAAMAPPR